MTLEATTVFEFLFDNYDPDRKQIFVMEGSSGSSKTHSVIQFLTYYSQLHAGKAKKITCGRSKMTWTIDTIYDDFKGYLDKNSYRYDLNKTKHAIGLNGNRYRFVGADDDQKFHGPRQDVAWLNEAMEFGKNSFDQINMRTNELVILDYNPSATVHWIYSSLTQGMRPHGEGYHKVMVLYDEDGNPIEVDVFYLRSTFMRNPFLPSGQRAVILGYDPSNPENVRNGTADEYKWKVYGLGERAQREGLIYKRWRNGYFNEKLPYMYGLDFGYDHPLALIKVSIDFENRIIFCKQIIHQRELTTSQFYKKFKAVVSPADTVIADPGGGLDKINQLRGEGYEVIPAEKGGGSVLRDIINMQDFLFIFDDSPELENEVNNYAWNPKIPDTPIKKFDDGLDAVRYVYAYQTT